MYLLVVILCPQVTNVYQIYDAQVRGLVKGNSYSFHSYVIQLTSFNGVLQLTCFLFTSFCSIIHSTVCFWRESPQWARASSFTRFLDHTQRRTTDGKDSSGQAISSSQRPLLDNTHNTHNRQTPMPPVGFASERPQTYSLDRAAAGTG